jgi:hypothetical protein
VCQKKEGEKKVREKGMIDGQENVTKKRTEKEGGK